MGRLEAYSTFGDFGNRPANELSERLASHAPMDGARVFLTSGGGDSIDAAAKIARRHWIQQGHPERVHLISRTQGYHGTHGFGTSIGGIEANTSNWGPLVPAVSAVAFDSLPALEAEIERVGPENVAAFFCEPVIGAGGVYPPPEGYIEGVADLCAEHGILLVIDSVICGFGRLGTWYGIERWEDVRPDMITFAKGVTAATCRSAASSSPTRVAAPVLRGAGRPDAAPRRHLRRPPGLLRRGDGRARRLRARRPVRARRASWRARSPRRWRRSPTTRPSRRSAPALGLLAAVQLAPEVLEQDAGAVAKVAQGAREAGVLVRPLLGAVAMLAAADRRAGAHRPARAGDPQRARLARLRAAAARSQLGRLSRRTCRALRWG